MSPLRSVTATEKRRKVEYVASAVMARDHQLELREESNRAVRGDGEVRSSVGSGVIPVERRGLSFKQVSQVARDQEIGC